MRKNILYPSGAPLTSAARSAPSFLRICCVIWPSTARASCANACYKHSSTPNVCAAQREHAGLPGRRRSGHTHWNQAPTNIRISPTAPDCPANGSAVKATQKQRSQRQ